MATTPEANSSDDTSSVADSNTLVFAILNNITDATANTGALPLADLADKISPLPTYIPTDNVLPGIQHDFHVQAPGRENSPETINNESLAATAIPEPSSIGIVAASLLGGYAIGRYWRRRLTKSDT